METAKATGRKKATKNKAPVVDPIHKHADAPELVNAGVAAFVPQDATLDDLLHTIRSVAKGITSLPPPDAESSLPQRVALVSQSVNPDQVKPPIRMTRREQNVIDLVAEGRSNKEIAELLRIAITTVRTHVHNILQKLSLLTRIELAEYARKGDVPV